MIFRGLSTVRGVGSQGTVMMVSYSLPVDAALWAPRSAAVFLACLRERLLFSYGMRCALPVVTAGRQEILTELATHVV